MITPTNKRSNQTIGAPGTRKAQAHILRQCHRLSDALILAARPLRAPRRSPALVLARDRLPRLLQRLHRQAAHALWLVSARRSRGRQGLVGTQLSAAAVRQHPTALLHVQVLLSAPLHFLALPSTRQY